MCLEAEDVGEVLNEYFASVFIQEKDMEDSEISVEHANMLRHFEIKKEVLDLSKSIKVATGEVLEDCSLKVVMQVGRVVKKAYGMLVFIGRGIEYK
eukprot:g34955.t1